MKERILRIGERDRLMAILTLPDDEQPLDRPTILIPNTGIEHRVGPNRMHVHIARALARQGYATLRLDVGGLGDSDAPRGESPNATLDLQQAMDRLSTLGLPARFVVLGLCTGAHEAHQLARCDSRVAGCLFIDGYAYPTLRFKCQYWLNRITHPHRAWSRAARILGLNGQASALAKQSLNEFLLPQAAEVRRDYEQLLARGVHLAFVFTGDMQDEYLYEGQHFDVFPILKDHARVQYLPHADHTLSRHQLRVELIQLIQQWLASLHD